MSMTTSARVPSLLAFAGFLSAALGLAAPAIAQTGLDFDGSNDYVAFGQAPGLGFSAFTLEVWLYREGPGATTSTGTGGVTAVPLLTKGRGEEDGDTRDMNYFLGIRGSDGVLVADYEEGTGQTQPGLNHPVVGVTPIREGAWYHAAATFDGTTWKLYLNGQLDAELVIGANRLPQSASIQHAALASALRSAGEPSGYFNGVLDEARIWDHARTQEDIAADMFSELASGSGLAGRWGLNDGTGTAALNSVPGGVDGALLNGPAWVQGSPFSLSNSLALGASSAYVTFGNPPELGLPEFTVEAWFRKDGVGTAVTTGTGGVVMLPLVTKGSAEVDGDTRDMNYVLGIRGTNPVLVADFEEGTGGATPGLNHPLAGVTPVVDGQWYHAAATYDGTTLRLYLNGFLENELAIGEPPQSASIQPAGLGTCLRSAGTPNGYFDGAFDEVRIWDHARTQPEIAATINDEITMAASGLVARWGLNEGARASVHGSAGTDITGAITGAGWSWEDGAPFNAPVEPPAAPSDLVAEAASCCDIALSWTDNSSTEAGFEIERSEDGPSGPFEQIAVVGAGVGEHSDGDLEPLTEYCYRVRAVNGAGESNWSDVACDTTLEYTGYALGFGGTDAYVTFGVAPSLGLPEFTVETWFRREGEGQTVNTGSGGVLAVPLVTKGKSEQDGDTRDMNYFLGIRGSDGVLIADFEEGAGGESPGQNHPVTGVTPIEMDRWYHAAVTYDGSEWRLYLDGMLERDLFVGEPPQSASIQHAGLACAMNSTGESLGRLDGVLDEVRVWDRARSIEEIQAAINDVILTAQPNLVARWGLDENAGTAVHGSAGTSVDGSIVGADWSWRGGAPFDIEIDNVPEQPVLNRPAEMAVGVTVPVELDVTVTDPEGAPLTVTYYGRPVTYSAGRDFTVVFLPDTQFYSAEMNGGTADIYRAQTQWIVDNKSALNIAYVLQAGDCVQDGDSNQWEWDNAWSALSTLEDSLATGLPHGLPYAVDVGNHDQTPGGDPNGTTNYYNQYFGEAHFGGRPYYGGHYGANNDNNYTLFSSGGLDFIVLSLEYGSWQNADVLAWADSLLGAHPSRWAIVSSHDMIGGGNPATFSSSGQAIYDALKDNPNLFLMLCGHISNEGRRTDNDGGRTVHTLLADYQNRSHGGDGWLRIMTFKPRSGTIRVKTYSPTLNLYEADSDSSSQFTLPCSLAPLGGWQVLGTVAGVPSGSDAVFEWPGLAPFSWYEWYVTVSDGSSTVTGPTWRFKTASEPPTAEVVFPNGGEVLEMDATAGIQWTATDDLGVVGIDLYLSRDGAGGAYEPIAAYLPNTGSFDWTVTGPATQNAYFKVVAMDDDEQTTADMSDTSFVISDGTGVPDDAVTEFALSMRSPNPSGGDTQFVIAVPRASRVRLAVYDAGGRLVTVLADGVLPAGRHPVAWNGETGGGRAASGVYFVKLKTPEKELSERVVLVR